MNSTISRLLHSVYLFSFFGSVLMISALASYAQTISIGAPVDGVEAGSNVSFMVYVEGGGVNNTGSAITGLINYSGTADYATDFIGLISFSIPNGVDSVQVPVNLLDDIYLEADETIIATISSLSGGSIGTSVSMAILADDDLTQVQVSVGQPTNRIEGTGSITFKVFFEGGVINLSGTAITGDLTFSGTAINGVDFTGTSSFSLGWGMNSSTVTVNIVNDAIVELPETVIVTISNLSVGSILNSSSTATIFDDDSGDALVSIGYGMGGVEGSSDVSFRAYMADGGVNTTGAPITGTVNYSGTATNGIDYTAPVSFAIPAGASSDTLDIPLINDAIPETLENINATISNLSSGFIVKNSDWALITDDDAQSVVVSIGSPVDAIEGTSDVSFQFFIEGGGVNNSGVPIVGTADFLWSTATYGADFDPVTEFVIPAGASSTTVTVPVVDDYIVEPTETVSMSIIGLNLGVIGTATSVAEIVDDESAQYSLSISQFSDGLEGGSDIALSISLDNGVVNTAGVPITGMISYGGTANTSIDYAGAPNSFSIPVGSSSTQLLLAVTDDLLVECDESIIATISNQSFGSIGLATDTAIIVDDECAGAAISIHSPTDGAELGSDVEFIISFDGGLTNGTGSVITGTLDLSGGTATPGVDFVDQQTFQLGIGMNATTVTISVIDEFDIEGTESIIATISNPSFAMIGTGTSTAYIFDNDSTSGIAPIENLNLSIYPNPMSSNLTFRSEKQMKSYSIVDLNGRKVSSAGIMAKECVLDAKFLSAGTYLVHVLFENGDRVSKKLIKN